MNNIDIASFRADASIADYAAQYLQRARSNAGGMPTYVCPECGNGTGSDGTGISFTGDGLHLKCFKCGKSFDVLDIAGHATGEDGFVPRFLSVCEWAGIDPARYGYQAGGAAGTGRRGKFGPDDVISTGKRTNSPKAADAASEATGKAKERQAEAERPVLPTGQEAGGTPQGTEEGRAEEAAYIERCRQAMTDDCDGMRYMTGRGFSADAVRAAGVGWDAGRRRVVIPWEPVGGYYHIDRAVDGDGRGKYRKPKADKVGPQPLHNAGILLRERPGTVFVVEGMLDAMAVEGAGQPCIGLAGTAWRDLVDEAKRARFSGDLVFMLDFDETGRASNRAAVQEARDAGLNAWGTPPLPGGCKDAAQALAERPEEFAAHMEHVAREFERIRWERYEDALSSLRVVSPAATLLDLYEMSGAVDPVPTGLKTVDDALGGGLMPGLTVLAAISSLGKTTLLVQIADHIAASGRSVLFVSIEQSARELVAKSVSRLMRASGAEKQNLATSQEMYNRKRRAAWSGSKAQTFLNACNEYHESIAPRLRFIEGDGPVSATDIRKAADAMAERDGMAPVVFIDYLQLLAPMSERDTDKQTADKNVTALRQMARDLNTPVLVISSINRQRYSGAITLDAFKESGGIEYGADVALGLQPAGIADKDKDSDAAKAIEECKRASERRCELVVLKNRNGALPAKPVPLTMRAASSVFEEGGWCPPAKAVKML